MARDSVNFFPVRDDTLCERIRERSDTWIQRQIQSQIKLLVSGNYENKNSKANRIGWYTSVDVKHKRRLRNIRPNIFYHLSIGADFKHRRWQIKRKISNIFSCSASASNFIEIGN